MKYFCILAIVHNRTTIVYHSVMQNLTTKYNILLSFVLLLFAQACDGTKQKTEAIAGPIPATDYVTIDEGQFKVNGKTYKATTNSKGKATFKITKLNKKGTFKATITYKGNKYYNKITKKANIKVIVTFKTVSKGSKDKSTVKEIQQALKDHGYYLSYKGHYLKVDGKFQSCTERSVKEFQHDKGLKVTGKVDEKTAKKLGLI